MFTNAVHTTCMHCCLLQAHNGGLVSPSGLSFIGNTYLKPGEIPAAAACKRMVLDEAIAKAAIG